MRRSCGLDPTESLAQQFDLSEWGNVQEQHLLLRQVVIDELLFVVGGNFTGKAGPMKNLRKRSAFPAGELDRRHGTYLTDTQAQACYPLHDTYGTIG